MTETTIPSGFHILTHATEIKGPAGDTRQVVLSPAGRVESLSGSYLMDRQAADLIIAAFQAHGVRLPIDVEHATLYKAEQGEPAPAAGWIIALHFDEQRGLIGDVKWTDQGRQAIASGSYGYLSPVLAVRKSDERAVALHSAALVNKPAIGHMERLTASEGLHQFLVRLHRAEQGSTSAPPKGDGGGDGGGGGGDGGGNGAADRIRELLGALREALGLAEDASLADIFKAAAEALTETTAQPQSLTAMRAQVQAEVQAAHQLEQALEVYVGQGKLNRADDVQMLWARNVASHDLALFHRLMRAHPVLIPQGRTEPPDGVPGGGGRESVILSARQRFRSDPTLQKLTTEDAVVNLALRESSFEPSITPAGQRT